MKHRYIIIGILLLVILAVAIFANFYSNTYRSKIYPLDIEQQFYWEGRMIKLSINNLSIEQPKSNGGYVIYGTLDLHDLKEEDVFIYLPCLAVKKDGNIIPAKVDLRKMDEKVLPADSGIPLFAPPFAWKNIGWRVGGKTALDTNTFQVNFDKNFQVKIIEGCPFLAEKPRIKYWE